MLVEVSASAKPKHFCEMREPDPYGYNEKGTYRKCGMCLFGGDEEDRTLDLTDANRTLSQLSYAPKEFPMRYRIGSIDSLSYLLRFVK